MFKNNQAENKTRTGEDNSSKLINLVGSATTIQGEISTESDIRVDGRIDGNIHTHTKLVLGEGGVIKGNVYCESADISGQIQGDVYCRELLKLQATTQIQGDINTKRMVLEKGVTFSGHCNMQDQVTFPEQPNAGDQQSTTSSSTTNTTNLGKVEGKTGQ